MRIETYEKCEKVKDLVATGKFSISTAVKKIGIGVGTYYNYLNIEQKKKHTKAPPKTAMIKKSIPEPTPIDLPKPSLMTQIMESNLADSAKLKFLELTLQR